MSNTPYTILAECRTAESWTVNQHGTPEDHYCDHDQLDVEFYYIHADGTDYELEYFDTFEKAQQELSRLNALFYLSNPQAV